MKERKKGRSQWHAPFCAVTQLELRGNEGLFAFYPEHELSRKPIKMDLLVIKKLADIVPENEIAAIFRGHNVLEYKSPGDALNIDTYYKVLAYACLYKSQGERADERKSQDMTVTLVREKRPVRLFRQFETIYGYRIEQPFKGIYYITGNVLFPTQVIATEELDLKAHSWLRGLTRNLTNEVVDAVLAQSECLKEQGDIDRADAALNLMSEMNGSLFDQRKVSGMEKLWLHRMFKDEFSEMDEKLKNQDQALQSKEKEIQKLTSQVRKLEKQLAAGK